MAELPRTRRRWFRFSLRTFLLVITILCVWLGLQISAARRQREAVDAILRVNGTVTYDYQRVYLPGNPKDYFNIDKNAVPPGPGWLRKLIGNDFFCNVTDVRFDKASQTTRASDLAELSKLPLLESINLEVLGIDAGNGEYAQPIEDVHLSFAKDLTRLQTVVLSCANINGDGLANLAKSKQLKYLFLDRTRLNDLGMQHVGKMTALKSLDINDTPITDSGLKHIQQLTNLEELNLTRTSISDVGLRNLNSDRLDSLALYKTHVGDDSMTVVGKQLGLRYLYLDETHVTDKGMAFIQPLTNLNSLGLSNTDISDSGFRYVSSTQLQSLSLINTKVGNPSMSKIGQMTNLGSLSLSGTLVTDEGLVELKNLKRLWSLQIDNTKVSDKGIGYLMGLPSLRLLHVSGTQMSVEGIQYLKKSLPNTTIYDRP